MSEENIAETTEAEKEVDVEETSSEDATSNIESEIDYKAMADQAIADKKKAEDALATKRFKSKEKEEETYEEEVDEGDKPVTKKELQELLSASQQATQKQVESQKIADLATKLADSEDEAQAIKAVHNSRIFPAGMSLEDQLEETYAIVNRKRIVGENKELKRALNSKANVSTHSSNAVPDSTASTAGEPKLEKSRRETLRVTGFEYNQATKQFEKSLSKTHKLVHDHKTGKNTRVAI